MRRAVGPAKVRGTGKCRQPQFGKLLHQLDQDRLEARDGLVVGGTTLIRLAEGFDDEVDRPVVEMQPLAVLQPVDLRALHQVAPFEPARRNCASGGHGF